jgi:hypothetical protein
MALAVKDLSSDVLTAISGWVFTIDSAPAAQGNGCQRLAGGVVQLTRDALPLCFLGADQLMEQFQRRFRPAPVHRRAFSSKGLVVAPCRTST